MSVLKLVWVRIALVVAIIVVLCYAFWALFFSTSQQKINPLKVTKQNKDITVSVPTVESELFVPKGFDTDFTNEFGYSGGGGRLENEYITISIRREKTTTKPQNKDIVVKSYFVNTTPFFVQVRENPDIYRPEATVVNNFYTYYQRYEKDGNLYHTPYLSLIQNNTDTDGIYFQVLFKDNLVFLEEKQTQLELADKVIQSLNNLPKE